MSIDEVGGHNIDDLRDLHDAQRDAIAADPTLVFVPGTFRRYGEFACCGGCDCPAAQVIDGVREGHEFDSIERPAVSIDFTHLTEFERQMLRPTPHLGPKCKPATSLEDYLSPNSGCANIEPAPADPWAHRSEGMRCSTCMWYVPKHNSVSTREESKHVGRCRRHCPTMNGYPVVFATDWCGDHKLNENAG